MVPGRGVIPGPGEAVALSSRVSRPGQHKWTLIGPEFQQALEGGAGILESDNVVNLGMRRGAAHETWLVDAVNATERHGHARAAEDRRFVHVVPESGNARLH